MFYGIYTDRHGACPYLSAEAAGMTDPRGFTLLSRSIEPPPLVNQLLRWLRFEEILARHLPPAAPRAHLAPLATQVAL
jgi:hypothetical protein